MPVARDYTVYSYNDVRDGQIAVGTLNSPWFDTSGGSKLLLMGVVTNGTGTTTVQVEFSFDGVTVHQTSADQLAQLGVGVELNNAYPYARLKVVQATAATTAAKLAAKVSD